MATAEIAAGINVGDGTGVLRALDLPTQATENTKQRIIIAVDPNLLVMPTGYVFDLLAVK